MPTEKILITGANGFVGSHLVDEALGRNLQVYAGVRANSNLEFLTNPRIKFCDVNFENEKAIRALLEKERFDYIIHNAGVTRSNTNAGYFNVNVEYTQRLAKVAASLTYPIKKFVFISSIEAYGSADKTAEGFVDESTPPSPRTTYGQSKQRAEQTLKNIVGLPWIILRPTAVFGPRERDLFELFKTIKKFRIEPIVGSPHIKYTFVYVKDLVRVTLDATLSPLHSRGYFVSDGRIHKMKNFTRYIAQSLGVKTRAIRIPLPIIGVVVQLLNVLNRFKTNKNLLNDEQYAKMKAENWDCDISPLVRDFNFEPQYSLEQALHETVKWYKQNEWL